MGREGCFLHRRLKLGFRVNLRFADAAGGVAFGYELVAGGGEVLRVCA